MPAAAAAEAAEPGPDRERVQAERTCCCHSGCRTAAADTGNKMTDKLLVRLGYILARDLTCDCGGGYMGAEPPALAGL